MSEKQIPLDYVNDLVFELEKAFHDERGKGARFRMTTVGRQFYQENCLPLIQSEDVDQIIKTVEQVLKDKGIITQVSYEREERLFKLRVTGCIHRQVEERMVAKGVEPFTCVPANLVVLAIEEKLDRPVELAEIRVEDGACSLLLILFEQRPSLD